MPRRKRHVPRTLPIPRLRVTDIFAKGERKKSWFDRLADTLTRFFGTIWFLLLNLCIFSLWFAINLGWIFGFRMFDPFPFNLLTAVLSIEAIVLSIVVLMSQKRASHVADIREQVDLEVNIHAEREITKILNILDDMQHRVGVSHADDSELESMKRRLDIKRLEERVRKRIAKE